MGLTTQAQSYSCYILLLSRLSEKVHSESQAGFWHRVFATSLASNVPCYKCSVTKSCLDFGTELSVHGGEGISETGNLDHEDLIFFFSPVLEFTSANWGVLSALLQQIAVLLCLLNFLCGCPVTTTGRAGIVVIEQSGHLASHLATTTTYDWNSGLSCGCKFVWL